nr:MAG: hypothetical protein [Bacteriophage sp.]
MKIKQLKEKTIKGFIDFLPKLSIEAIPGLQDIINGIKTAINDKLSKSEGGEINKPIVITDEGSAYKTIINPDGSIFILNKNTNNNVFSLINTNNGIIINDNVYAPIRVNSIDSLYDKHGNSLYNGTSKIFHANGFIINNGTRKQVLLGDGSTTNNLIKHISFHKTVDGCRILVTTINDDVEDTMLSTANEKVAGFMSAPDKTKLDDIEHTYLPLSGGTLTGTLRLNKINSDQSGLDIINVNGMQSVDQDKILNPEVWTTNGTSINILTLLSNAAIYVAGEIGRTKFGVDSTIVIDNPDSILFDTDRNYFLARKDSMCYCHWTANISKNIASPSRYGTESNLGVFPFNNQMYKFSNQEHIYIATCSNGTCNMKKLTLE